MRLVFLLALPAYAQDAPEAPATPAAQAPADLPSGVSPSAVDLDAPSGEAVERPPPRRPRLDIDRPRDTACVNAAADVNATRKRLDELRKALAACEGAFECVDPLRSEMLALDRKLEAQMRSYDDACLKSGTPLPQKPK